MKNLSKVLAVVLAFAMALSMVSFAAYSDIEAGADCEEAVTVLSSLGILSGYQDGTFKPEATITRAEFASVVIRMLGYGDIAGGGSVVFTDVPADHWANGVIALAASQGIISGYGDGRFGPEDPVNYEQAIAMVVRALGYTPMADANGGYPGGYQVVASSKGILAGTVGAPGTPANRGTVAQFVYNSLTVPMMEQTSFGTDTEYKPVKKLILNNHGVTKFEAVVDNTSASSASVKAGKIVVDYKNQVSAPSNNAALAVKYDAPTSVAYPYVQDFTDVTIKATGEVEEAAKALIDVASVMYVKNAESSDAELLCIMKDGDKNKTVEFMAEDLKAPASLDASAEDVLEVYTDKDAGEFEEIEIDITKVYVNGRQTSIEAIDVAPAGAGAEDIAEGAVIDTDAEYKEVVNFYLQANNAVDVKLLANDANEEDVYKVAYITVWTDGVVENISARNWKVYTDNGTYTLDETDTKNQNFTIYKDGKVASFADIKENDVLSVAGYKDGSNVLKYGEVYITSEKVEGKVSGTVTSAATVAPLYIDGTEYKADKTGVRDNVKIGNSYVFYKNARGVLVGLDKTESAANLKYGFASWIYVDNNFGDAKVRLLTADGVWSTIDLADRINAVNYARTDVNKYDTADIIWAGSDADKSIAGINNKITDTNKYPVNKIVAYELDDKGEIKTFYAAPYGTVAGGSEFANDTFSADGSAEYFAATSLLGGYSIDESTIIFSYDNAVTSKIDANAATVDTLTEISVADEKKITVVSVSTLADRTNYDIDYGYNEDEDSHVWPVLFGKGVKAGIDWTSDFFVVSADPMTTTNEDGDSGIMLTGVQAGEEVSIFLNSEDLVAADVQKVTYATDSADEGDALSDEEITSASDFNKNNIAKGDVLIYSLNAKGEVAEIKVLLDASTMIDSSNADANYNALKAGVAADDEGYLGKVTVGTTTYHFILGYAKDRSGSNVTLVGGDNSTEKVFRFSSDVIGASYNAFKANGKVVDAVYGDITFDPKFPDEADDGDFVFARVSNNVVVDDFVIIANDR